LTQSTLEFSPNAVNRGVQKGQLDIRIPLTEITAVQTESAAVTNIIVIEGPGLTLKVRCFRAEKFAEQIRAASQASRVDPRRIGLGRGLSGQPVQHAAQVQVDHQVPLRGGLGFVSRWGPDQPSNGRGRILTPFVAEHNDGTRSQIFRHLLDVGLNDGRLLGGAAPSESPDQQD